RALVAEMNAGVLSVVHIAPERLVSRQIKGLGQCEQETSGIFLLEVTEVLPREADTAHVRGFADQRNAPLANAEVVCLARRQDEEGISSRHDADVDLGEVAKPPKACQIAGGPESLNL